MSGCFNNSQEDRFHERELDEHSEGLHLSEPTKEEQQEVDDYVKDFDKRVEEGNELKPIINNILQGFCNAQENIQKARESE